ncbi:MAG: sulfite exporter TauE/SafE family protein [Marinobacter sp.]|nr:sulfite exporter TauE/SafE family protein [Marinobacter sp.]
MDSFIALLDGLSPLSGGTNALLIFLSLITSWITSAFGIGGSALLIMSMAQVMPPVAVIPIHGMVQLGANGSRFTMTWRDVDYRRLAAIVPGILIGAAMVSWLLIRLPPGVLELTIASFMIFMCWGAIAPLMCSGHGRQPGDGCPDHIFYPASLGPPAQS